MVQNASFPSFATSYQSAKAVQHQVKFGHEFSPLEAVVAGTTGAGLWEGMKAAVMAIHRKRTKQASPNKKLTQLGQQVKNLESTITKQAGDFKQNMQNLSYIGFGATIGVGILGIATALIKKKA